jgi:hypothetical protein
MGWPLGTSLHDDRDPAVIPAGDQAERQETKKRRTPKGERRAEVPDTEQ